MPVCSWPAAQGLVAGQGCSTPAASRAAFGLIRPGWTLGVSVAFGSWPLGILHLLQEVRKVGLVLPCSPQGLCFRGGSELVASAFIVHSGCTGPYPILWVLQHLFRMEPGPAGHRATSCAAGQRRTACGGERCCCRRDNSGCGFNYWGLVVWSGMRNREQRNHREKGGKDGPWLPAWWEAWGGRRDRPLAGRAPVSSPGHGVRAGMAAQLMSICFLVTVAPSPGAVPSHRSLAGAAIA